jgi:Na+/H+ antiporter NhaD/arsenite permease-like protein
MDPLGRFALGLANQVADLCLEGCCLVALPAEAEGVESLDGRVDPLAQVGRPGRPNEFLDGAFAGLVHLVTHPDGTPNVAMYFWMTGILSSFLDNAPTYLVFFNLAGGDPETLMGPLAATLAAISAGAVFMGANSYIGNAPNFMVKAVAEKAGIKMPSFFGYMLWSGAFLLPLFALVTMVYFR